MGMVISRGGKVEQGGEYENKRGEVGGKKGEGSFFEKYYLGKKK